jgi:hypothetical protein
MTGNQYEMASGIPFIKTGGKIDLSTVAVSHLPNRWKASGRPGKFAYQSYMWRRVRTLVITP